MSQDLPDRVGVGRMRQAGLLCPGGALVPVGSWPAACDGRQVAQDRFKVPRHGMPSATDLVCASALVGSVVAGDEFSMTGAPFEFELAPGVDAPGWRGGCFRWFAPVLADGFERALRERDFQTPGAFVVAARMCGLSSSGQGPRLESQGADGLSG